MLTYLALFDKFGWHFQWVHNFSHQIAITALDSVISQVFFLFT